MSPASYRQRIVGAEDAVKVIQSGDRVWIHPGTATPQRLVDAMVARAGELKDVELVHLLHFGTADYVKPEMEGHFRANNFFIGANVRQAVNEGRADTIPIFLGEVPALFLNGGMRIDAVLLHLSPPDEHGFCSFGCGVDCTRAAAQMAKVRIAQINPKMPRCLGNSFIHVSKLDYIVEVDDPIITYVPHPVTEMHKTIASFIAPLIEDGSTLQMGIGGVPDAVLLYLDDKKDLGVHTEMFGKGIVPLIEKGILTGDRKTLLQGKIVGSFFFGDEELYDFCDNNPLFEFRPTEFTNDPYVIAENDKMVAINSALQVDLSGQVCADSIGYAFYSGFGGQVDFIRGAARSKGGKPIIALPSTAKDGAISRIVPMLDLGAGVVTTRADVHYVVTEFGAAYLHGRNVRQRAEALITIAHPNFRDELTQFCREHKIFK
jgi:4-hydroxybutyrate CoA-transferase